MAVTLTEKGQITIPLAVRRRLGLKPGMRLAFDDTVPYLKAIRVVDVEQMRRALGCLASDGTPDAQKLTSREMIEVLRGPADA